jgi:ADP-L-glycero-D-manno-heptose 6-epimerase
MTLYFDPLTASGKDLTGIYNIGSGTASTWLELAEAIFSALDKEPKIEFIDMPDNIKNQYQYYSKANISRLREAGYSKPCISLKDSVKDYVQNYLMKDKYLSV